MEDKIFIKISLTLCVILILLFSNHCNASKNSDTFVFATNATLSTLDPCAAYDSASFQKIMNIYEPLIFYDGSHIDRFIPVIVQKLPDISADGKTYIFTIKKGIKFHNGQNLDPEDVSYSFKRNMIADPARGPMWMLLEPLTGYKSTRDENGKIIPGIFEKINKSICVQDEKIIFNLPKAFPPFLSILVSSACVTIDKDWAILKNCWDGNIQNAKKYNNPKPGHEPLQKIANGTGAYKLKRWVSSKEFIFERFDQYHGLLPKIKQVIIKYVKEWSTRKLMLQKGAAHRVTVEHPYFNEVKNMKGLNIQTIKQLSVSCAFFCQKVDPVANPNIASGKLDGKGIPLDFFSDINIRKAFLHAFDREAYKQEVFNNEVYIPTSPNIIGLSFHKEAPIYKFDLNKSIYYFKKAWNGEIWKKGFSFIIAYNTGNEVRQAAAVMLAENIMSLNEKFKIEIRNISWKDYLVKYRSFRFPIFITGWVGDYADPHNFLTPFMHSRGIYGPLMGYKNSYVDELCDAGINTNNFEKRKVIYHKLQDLWYEDAPGILLYQQTNLRVYRKNVKGYVPNPMLSDAWEDLKKLRIKD